MHVTMVKKRLSSGEACPKCGQVEEMLRRRGLWDRVDEVIWAIEDDDSSPGMRLAATHGVERAPFFVVQTDDGAAQVYVSALRMIKAHLKGADKTEEGAEVSVNALARELEDAAPETIVKRALEIFGADCAIAFSGAEDVALIHMAAQTGLPFSVFVLDTGRLHPETYAFIDRIRRDYGLTLDVMSPDAAALQDFVGERGLFSFYDEGHGPCCAIRKVEPLGRALARRRAWMTGQRRDQSPSTRASVNRVEADHGHLTSGGTPLCKINPLADWSSEEVWSYLRAHEIPTNPLHEAGFRSIGCEPCTRPVRPEQHEREGRWWWEDDTKKECGLHITGKG